jgi:RNA polymerase sigma-70 factor (ECF subfamily)
MNLAALNRKLWQKPKHNDLIFKTVYQQHYQQVLTIAKSLTGSNNEAEDITQEVFIAVIKSLPKFKGESTLSTWLYRITCRIAQRYMIKSRNNNTSLEDEINEAQKPNDDLHLSTEKINQAISKLPLMQRTILSLICFAGLSHQQVAEILDVPVGTVWSRLHQARKSLAENSNELN